MKCRTWPNRFWQPFVGIHLICLSISLIFIKINLLALIWLNASDVTLNDMGKTGTKPQLNIAVLKIRAICHDRVFWELVRSCKQLHLLCPPDSWNLTSTHLLSGFHSPGELWNPFTRTILSKYSFILSNGPVNIWNTESILIFWKTFSVYNVMFKSMSVVWLGKDHKRYSVELMAFIDDCIPQKYGKLLLVPVLILNPSLSANEALCHQSTTCH